jgi:hypothetical protein
MTDSTPTQEESSTRIARVKAIFAKARGSVLIGQPIEGASAAIVGVKELQRFKLAFEMPTVADRHLVVSSLKTALGPDRKKAEEAALFVAKVAEHAPLVDMNRVHVPWQSATPRPGARTWEQWDPRSGMPGPRTGTPPQGTWSHPHEGTAPPDRPPPPMWEQFNQLFDEHLRGGQVQDRPTSRTDLERDIFVFFSSIGSVLGIDDDGIIRRARTRQTRIREEAPPAREEARDIIDTFLRNGTTGSTTRRKRKRRQPR